MPISNYVENWKLVDTYYKKGYPITVQVKTNKEGKVIFSANVPELVTAKGKLRRLCLITSTCYNPITTFYWGLFFVLLGLDEQKLLCIWKNNPEIQKTAEKVVPVLVDERQNVVASYASTLLPYIQFRIRGDGFLSTVYCNMDVFLTGNKIRSHMTEQEKRISAERHAYLYETSTMQYLLDLYGIQQGSFVREGKTLNIKFTVCKDAQK